MTATLALNFVEETPQRSVFTLYFAMTLPRGLLENLVALIIFFWSTRSFFLCVLCLLRPFANWTPHLFESSDVNSLMSSILLIRSFLLRVEMDASSTSMFVWFIWCSWVLTKRNEKLAKQFIQTAHEQSTFLHFLGKCGNNKSVCIISHIIVPALWPFKLAEGKLVTIILSKTSSFGINVGIFSPLYCRVFFCSYSHSNHPLIQRCVRCPWTAWVSKACLFCVFNQGNDLSICGVLL